MEDLGNHSQDLGNRSPAAPEKHTAWVIWLHGLGDSGTGWTHLMHAVGAQLPHVKWSFPDAAEQSVTCKGGARMRSWFDITELPMTPSQEIGIDGELRISSKALCEPQGLQAAISMVHAMLAQAESMGYPPDRIVLGGFSQGAALALLAARLYRKTLAGVICLSGWHLRPQRAKLSSSEYNLTTPIMLLHGTHDETVPITCYQESIDLLLNGGHRPVTYHSFSGEGHGDCAAARRQILDFLRHHVPPVNVSPAAASTSETEQPVAANVPARSKTVIKMGGRRGATRDASSTRPPITELQALPEECPGAPELPELKSAQVGPQLPTQEVGPHLAHEEMGPHLPTQSKQPLRQDLPSDAAFSITDGEGAIRVTVPLPSSVDGMSALDLSLVMEGMQLAWPTSDEQRRTSLSRLRLAWPRSDLNVDAASAKWSKKRHELKIVVPYSGTAVS